MKRLILQALVTLVAIVSLGVVTLLYRSHYYIHYAVEDTEGLYMSAYKGIGGSPYYVGSEDEYSFFCVGNYFRTGYKAKTSDLKLPRTFPLEEEEPYLVTHEMVTP